MPSNRDPMPTGASARLVTALGEGRQLPGVTLRRFADLPTCLSATDLAERPIIVDQTNASVVVAEQVVVKWMRPPSASRAPDLLAHLADVGFTRTPTPYGAAFRGEALVALVTAYLPDAVDGWDWCVDGVLEHLSPDGPPTEFAVDLGTLAAELHAALATPSATVGAPVRHAPPSSDWPKLLAQALDLAVAAGDDDGRWFARHHAAVAADLTAGMAAADGEPVVVIRTHGDLHVGQVLRWRGGYAVVDFDGPPTGGAPWEPAVRDVAQLRTSLLHVGQIADRRTAGRYHDELLEWGKASADALLDAYRTGLARRGLAHLLDERLLRAYELAQECRELVYAARFLPRWRYAPMGVLRSWYG
jgi:maltokinase